MLRQNPFIFLLGLAIVSPALFGVCALRADETSRLVAMMQDEQRRLPPDNTVLFSAAARSVTIRLDSLQQFESSELSGTMLTVIDSNGDVENFEADESGVVTIPNVQPGPHAIVANNDDAHGSTLLMFEEEGTDQNRLQAPDTPAPLEVGKARMTLVKLNSKDLIPIVDKYLPPSNDGMGRFVASDLVSRGGFGASAFSVRVGADDQLYGQVISLLRRGLSGAELRGTHLSLFRDGLQVGQTVCDDIGRFMIPNVTPGPYGIVAAGPAGYTAFGFRAVRGNGVVKNDGIGASQQQLVSTTKSDQLQLTSMMQEPADVLPCVLIPPQFIPQVTESIRSYYPPLAASVPLNEVAGISPLPGVGALGPSGFGGGVAPGGVAPGGFAGGGFAGGGGGGFAGGGLGGLAGLGAIGAVIAVSAANDDNGNGGIIISPTPVSPVLPSP